jgi:putative sterol carrier protein
MVSTVKQYFDTLDRRFKKDAARGLRAVFQFELSGQGAMTIAEGAHATPTVTLRMAADNYVRMANGELKGQWAYLTGKMKIEGNMMMAMKMQALFPPGQLS